VIAGSPTGGYGSLYIVTVRARVEIRKPNATISIKLFTESFFILLDIIQKGTKSKIPVIKFGNPYPKR
jgi:hypothetical protein